MQTFSANEDNAFSYSSLPTEKANYHIDCWNFGKVVKQGLGLGGGALDSFATIIGS